MELHSPTCMCPGCAPDPDSDSQPGLSYGDLPPLLKPTYTLEQIIDQLETNWGGQYEGTTRTWHQDTITYSMPNSAPTNAAEVPDEASGLVAMSATMKNAARLAFELWDDLIAIDLNESANSPSADITFNYSSATTNDSTYATPYIYPADANNDQKIDAND